MQSPIRMSALFFVLSVCVACGSDVVNGGGGQTGTGATGATGGSGGSQSVASGGSGGMGMATTGPGGAGGSVDCPDIACAKVCPGETWLDDVGCPTCVCASNLEMTIRGTAKPTQHLSLDAEVTEFIGGVDRWIFDLTWHYSDPMIADAAEDVNVQFAIMRTDPMFEPDDQPVSWCYPGAPLEDRGALYTLFGFGVITTDLTLVDGFLSIRDNGTQFEGFAYFDLTLNGDDAPVHVAAPFTIDVP